METVFVIFALGVVVSLVVAKGMMQANDYAKEELGRKGMAAREDEAQK